MKLNLSIPQRRNLQTQAKNRRESVWQIGLPLVGVALVLIALFVLILWSGSEPVRSLWADVALIFLIIPALVGGVVALALVVGGCVGAWYVTRKLPPLTCLVQDYLWLAKVYTQAAAARVDSVFIAPYTYWAAVQKFWAEVRASWPLGRPGRWPPVP